MSEKHIQHAQPCETEPEVGASATDQSDAEEFVSLVSHDLKSPLNAAKLYLERAQEEHESDHLDAVEESLDRMETLLDEFSSLTWTDQAPEQLAPVNLALMAKACWRTVETHDATLVVDTNRTILADASRFQQLLENLFGNAILHGSDDVTITLGDLDDGSGFFVEDDGPGILPEERDRVFEPGYSTSRDGTGFGLYIVEKVVRAHDWDLHVMSGSDGGARFEITGVEFEE